MTYSKILEINYTIIIVLFSVTLGGFLTSALFDLLKALFDLFKDD